MHTGGYIKDPYQKFFRKTKTFILKTLLIPGTHFYFYVSTFGKKKHLAKASTYLSVTSQEIDFSLASSQVLSLVCNLKE